MRGNRPQKMGDPNGGRRILIPPCVLFSSPSYFEGENTAQLERLRRKISWLLEREVKDTKSASAFHKQYFFFSGKEERAVSGNGTTGVPRQH